jgi:hypothetical protein
MVFDIFIGQAQARRTQIQCYLYKSTSGQRDTIRDTKFRRPIPGSYDLHYLLK